MIFNILYDREAVTSLDIKGLATFDKFGLINRGNVDRIHFCGVLVSGGEVYAVLPRNSINTGLSDCFIASLLLRVLDKYNTTTDKTVIGGDLIDEGREGLGLLASVLWLLHDYSANGTYSTTSKKRQHDSGKINWSRTISREIPEEGIGGAPIYRRLHTERIKYGEQSPVTLIHSDVIKELDRSFGWAITGDYNIRIASDLDLVPSSQLGYESKIYVLQRELSFSYPDRHIKLLNALIQILQYKFEGGAGEYLVGIKTFQTVWEEMLRRILPGVVNINKKLPKPAIYFKGSESPSLARGMVTDIVAKNGTVISVIDAKYYKGKTAQDSPGWHDLVKQFFYAKSLALIFPEFTIANWFAFPGRVGKINEGPITSYAVVDAEAMKPMVEDFPPIGCSYFCPVEVMQRYTSLSKFRFEEVSPLFAKSEIRGKAE